MDLQSKIQYCLNSTFPLVLSVVCQAGILNVSKWYFPRRFSSHSLLSHFPVLPNSLSANPLGVLCWCACPRDPSTHLSVRAIISLTAATVLTLGNVGYVVFEVIDEPYPFIHYWRWRLKPQHPGYHRDSPADQTVVKVVEGERGRRSPEQISAGEKWRCSRGMHREQESWERRCSILNRNITFVFPCSICSEILRLTMCPAFCLQTFHSSEITRIQARLTSRTCEHSFFTWSS